MAKSDQGGTKVEELLKQIRDISKESGQKLNALQSLGSALGLSALAGMGGSGRYGPGYSTGMASGGVGDIGAASRHVMGTLAEGMTPNQAKRNLKELRDDVARDYPGMKFHLARAPEHNTNDKTAYKIVTDDARAKQDDIRTTPGGNALARHDAEASAFRDRLAKSAASKKAWDDSLTVQNAAIGAGVAAKIVGDTLAPGYGSSGDTMSQYNAHMFDANSGLINSATRGLYGMASGAMDIWNHLTGVAKGPK